MSDNVLGDLFEKKCEEGPVRGRRRGKRGPRARRAPDQSVLAYGQEIEEVDKPTVRAISSLDHAET
jgi:hypothetical protein